MRCVQVMMVCLALAACGDDGSASSGGSGAITGGAGGMAATSGGSGGGLLTTGGMMAVPTGGTAGLMAASGAMGGAMSGGSGGATGGAGGSGGMTMVEPDAATMEPCDRACLIEIMTSYLDALIANDASSLPLAPDVRFTENGMELELTEGLWAVASTLSAYRQDFAEAAAGQVASFIKLEDDSGDVLLAVRLRVVERAITEIETIVCREGEAIFFSPQNLTAAEPIYDAELSPDDRLPRDEMIATVDTYFAGLEAGDGSDVPFGPGASRTENGVVTASGASISNLSAFSYIDTIKRRYPLVDEERGVALPFAVFEIPNGLGGARALHIAELFKVEDGQLMKIDAIMVNQPFGTSAGWD